MTQAVQLRKGTTSEHSTFTGLQAEATVDTTKKTIVVHDGSTAGGIPLSREDLSNANPSNLTTIVGADTASGDLFVVYDVSASAFKKITRAELNNAMEQDALASVAITGGSINGTTIGASTASTGAFTTLSASSTVTLSGGTANGVLYLNGSKVATSGSALTFDGATQFINATNTAYRGQLSLNGGASGIAQLTLYQGSTTQTNLVGQLYSLTDQVTLAASRASGYITMELNGSEQMRITSTGLGIGTSSPAYKLDVSTTSGDTQAAVYDRGSGSSAARLDLRTSGTGASQWYIQTGNTTSGLNGSLRFYDQSVGERARITSGGDLLVGTTSAAFGEKFNVTAGNQNGALIKNTQASENAILTWNASTTGDAAFIAFATETSYTGRGTINYNRGAGLVAYNTTSDYRAKDIIGPVANPGATIDALKVYTGKMKGASVERPMLVAHEAQAVAPYSVTGEKDAVNDNGDPVFQQMDVSSLVPLLIAEIQSLRQRVAQLEGTQP